jgi:hypothetical protein
MRKSSETITKTRAQQARHIDNVHAEFRRHRERQAQTEQTVEKPIAQTVGSAAIGAEPDHLPQPVVEPQAPIDIQVRRAEKEQRLTSAA